jgi:hypothetical protein
MLKGALTMTAQVIWTLRRFRSVCVVATVLLGAASKTVARTSTALSSAVLAYIRPAPALSSTALAADALMTYSRWTLALHVGLLQSLLDGAPQRSGQTSL